MTAAPPVPEPPPRRADGIARAITITVALLLPTLSLVPLGSLWLWERGYLVHWAVGAVAVAALATLAARAWLPARPVRTTATAADDDPTPAAADDDHGADPGWTPLETAAWADVQSEAGRIDVTNLTSREAILTLGVDTVRTVARRMHPEIADPVWQFTVPEALAIAERVSRRLATFTVENIPFSERLTVAHVLTLYRWRGAIGVAERAYDLWRLVRVVNPMTAATQELRERLSRQMLDWGRAQVTERLARAYVAEVGRAAIDLYGGRLHVESIDAVTRAGATDATEIAARVPEPLRILVTGGTGAGKSSLINALSDTFEADVDAVPTTTGFVPFPLRRTGLPPAYLIDSPGIDAISPDTLMAEAVTADLLLWVVPAHRADRARDRLVLTAVRDRYAALPDRRPPPLVVIATHVDKLRPPAEWAPPYDLADTARPKAVAMAEAIASIAADLGVPAADVVPVSLTPPAVYNVDAVWSRIAAATPDARRAQVVRRARAGRRWDWRRTWRQAVGAGRAIGDVLGTRDKR
jgi:hypothetical protein